MSFLVIMKKFGFKIVPLNLNLLSIEGTLMMYSCFFCSKHHIGKFQNYLNRQHKNIRITSETDNRNSISFLDIKIIRDNNKFMISVYGKPTFSRVFINFGSFIPNSYKYDLLFTLLHRAFNFYSNFELFHQKIDKLFLKITVTPNVVLIFVSKST